MGISVKVAKYMRAPEKAAVKLARNELPPRRPPTQPVGMSASWPGRPRRNPDTSTPANSSGRICSAKSRVATTHVRRSSFVNQRASAYRSTIPNAADIHHFAANTVSHMGLPPFEFAQLMNTRIPTMENI